MRSYLCSKSWHRPSWAFVSVCILVLLYVGFFGRLSILRHEMYQSNAMDLGYTDQVVWNTLRGRFMRFSTYENAPIDLPLDRFRRTDTLLAYHVELILVPVSLLYLVYDSPVTLLLLQTVVLGLGALPAFWIARKHLGSDLAGLVFASVFLLAPAVEGANLSDFHGVSLTATILLFAFAFLAARRRGAFLGCIIIALSAKEDIPLLVLMIGLYILVCRREVALGAVTASLGLGWFLICTQLILPYHNGLSVSPFFHRIALFGPTIRDSILNLIREPALLLSWVTQPQILTYLSGLLASGGFASLFDPAVLLLSAPIVAMNVFSTWSWTYSEGAHYSASIVPFIIISGIHGVGCLSRRISTRWKVRHASVVQGLLAVVMLVSAYHHYQIGISPLARSFYPPRITSHHRLGEEMMGLIPPAVPLSTQSGLYPHLAHRERAYLFPAVNDAEYVFLDVTGSSEPITLAEVYDDVQKLLSSGEFGVLAARDGYLLLQRGRSWTGGMRLPDEFYAFARQAEDSVPHRLSARFGDTMELVGYDYYIPNVVHAFELPVRLSTYWRPLEPSATGYVFAFFFSRQDGAIVGHYDGLTPTTMWYPVHLWQRGELVRVDTPMLSAGRLRDAMVAVVPAMADPWSLEDRLQPIENTHDSSLQVFDGGSLLRLFEFPQG